MVNINIAFDNEDLKLGAYFEKSKEDLADFLADNHDNYSIHEMNSKLCNEVYIETRLLQINALNFLFVAYSHGNENSLVAKQASYVETQKNTKLFINSFFYTTACATGKNLGDDLIANGCLAFIGYKTDVEVFLNQNQKISIDCDNQGIKMFILGKSIGEAFDSMKDYYTQQIDRLYQFGDILSASYLVANREALILLGNCNLNIQNFINN